MQDLKTLEQLQHQSGNQLTSMAEQAASDESQREESENTQIQADAIQQEAINQYQNTQSSKRGSSAQVDDLARKLGVAVEQGDYKLTSKEAIAQVMVQRAIASGKTEAQIGAAVAS